jgi:hypothetical protein
MQTKVNNSATVWCQRKCQSSVKSDPLRGFCTGPTFLNVISDNLAFALIVVGNDLKYSPL